MGSSVVSPEDVLESLMLDGTVDAIRLKIINQLKTNEELRNNTIKMAEESRVLNTPGAEKQTKRELFEALRAELETQALEMASKAVWELILDNNALGKEINETVEEVFCRLSGGKAPPFPMHPPQHQQPIPPPPPPLQPPQQPQPPLQPPQFSQQQQPPLPQLLQQLLQQQQQHGAVPPPFQPLAQLQHPPLAPLPQLPIQHFPHQHPPLPPQLQHPPLAPLPQLPLQRLAQQQQPPPPSHQLSQQQQPPLPPQPQEQPPPPPPSPPPPQPPPPPSPPSPMQPLQQLSPPPPSPLQSLQQLSPPLQQHQLPSLQSLIADVQRENDKDSQKREEGEKKDDIKMIETFNFREDREKREEGEKRDDIKMIESFNESNEQDAAGVGIGDTEIPTVRSSETEIISMDP